MKKFKGLALLTTLFASTLYLGQNCGVDQLTSSLQAEDLPVEKSGSQAAYNGWVRQTLYETPQYVGQSSIVGNKNREYAGDQYTVTIPKGQLTPDQAKEFIGTLRDQPSNIYRLETSTLLGWPDQPQGQSLIPGQKVGLRPNLPGVQPAPVVIRPGASGDSYSYGVWTGDFRGLPAGKTEGQMHPENGIREWAMRRDANGDYMFINRGFYTRQSDPLSPAIGATGGQFVKDNVPFASSSANAVMGQAQQEIWLSQQRDVIKHLKTSYGAVGTADNRRFNITMPLSESNVIKNGKMSANDLDLSIRNSTTLLEGKPFVDDIPRGNPAH